MTSTWMSPAISCLPVDLLRPLHEGIYESIGDVVEDRAHRLFQQLVGKLVVELEFDLAGGIPQGRELPHAIEMAERPFGQPDRHSAGGFLLVLGGEMSLQAVVVDVDAGPRDPLVASQELGSATPGQELRV